MYFLILPSLLNSSILFNCFYTCYIYGISGPSLLIESTDSMIINTNKNEASGASVQPIYMVKRSIDSSFCVLSGAICFVIELTRAEIL